MSKQVALFNDTDVDHYTKNRLNETTVWSSGEGFGVGYFIDWSTGRCCSWVAGEGLKGGISSRKTGQAF